MNRRPPALDGWGNTGEAPKRKQQERSGKFVNSKGIEKHGLWNLRLSTGIAGNHTF
jgi:hypothetical protein